MVSDYITTNIRLPARLHKKLKYRAVEEGKSLAKVVREALGKYLGEDVVPEVQEKAPAASHPESLKSLVGTGKSGDLGSNQHNSLFPDPQERRQRALEAYGRFHSGLDDLSINHDRYFLEDQDKQ